jgi:hypothetical protein
MSSNNKDVNDTVNGGDGMANTMGEHGYGHSHGMDEYVLMHQGQDGHQMGMDGGMNNVMHEHHHPHHHQQASMYVGDMNGHMGPNVDVVGSHQNIMMPGGNIMTHQQMQGMRADDGMNALYTHQQILGNVGLSNSMLPSDGSQGQPSSGDAEDGGQLKGAEADGSSSGAARKTSNSRQQKYKQNMTDEKRQKYRAADRARKASVRSKLTEEMKQKYREECRLRQSALRQQTNEDKKNSIRLANRQRQRELRSSLTDEARVAYLAAGRLSQQLARSRLGEEKKTQIREANRLRQRALRARKASSRVMENAAVDNDLPGGDAYIGMEAARAVPLPSVPSLVEGLQAHIMLQSARLPQDGGAPSGGGEDQAGLLYSDGSAATSGGAVSAVQGAGSMMGGHSVSHLTAPQIEAMASSMSIGGHGHLGGMMVAHGHQHGHGQLQQHMEMYNNVGNHEGQDDQQQGQDQDQNHPQQHENQQQNDHGSM